MKQFLAGGMLGVCLMSIVALAGPKTEPSHEVGSLRWSQLAPEQKLFYVMGVVDTWDSVIGQFHSNLDNRKGEGKRDSHGDQREAAFLTVAQYIGPLDCLGQYRAKYQDVRDLVDTVYIKHGGSSPVSIAHL